VAEDSPVINDLASVLFAFASGAHPHHLSVINTDNIPGNGDKIGNFIRACSFIKELHQSNSASAVAFLDFMKEHTTFHNTMVDRITSHRENDPLTPRSEPLPRKTLVIEDIHNVLPDVLDRSDSLGVIVRTREGDIATDYMLKLRVANATHSALVYAMVLNRCGDTRGCATESIYVEFIDKLVAYDIGILSSEGVAEDTLREVLIS
jgi:mannitol-1-phosphate/altronate dehydrogenase